MDFILIVCTIIAGSVSCDAAYPEVLPHERCQAMMEEMAQAGSPALAEDWIVGCIGFESFSPEKREQDL